MSEYSFLCFFAVVFLFGPSYTSGLTFYRLNPRTPLSLFPSRSSNVDGEFPSRRSSALGVAEPSLFLPIPPKVELAQIVCGGVILAIYHGNLCMKERRGVSTWRSVQADTREKWSRHVREQEAWLYAIQTLRNAITAQTFLATTVLSLLTVISGRLWDILRHLPKGNEREMWVAQFTLVALSMLTSAYHFLQSARLMTHAGFMFPVSKSTEVDSIMRKSENSQWLGLRCLYVSASFLSWIVGGSRAFLAASMLLTIFFRKKDKAPKSII